MIAFRTVRFNVGGAADLLRTLRTGIRALIVFSFLQFFFLSKILVLILGGSASSSEIAIVSSFVISNGLVIPLGSVLLATGSRTFAKCVPFVFLPSLIAIILPYGVWAWHFAFYMGLWSLLSLPGLLYVVAGPICAFFIAPAVIGLSRLRNLRNQVGGGELMAILDFDDPLLTHAKPNRRAPIGWPPKLTLVSALSFVVLALAAILYAFFVTGMFTQMAVDSLADNPVDASKGTTPLVLWVISTILTWTIHPLTWLLLAPLFLFWRRLRRVFAVDATTLLAGSTLPPRAALLLRSFVDDKVTVIPNSRTMKFQLRELRLEEVLITSLGQDVPCVALGAPQENLPHLGAYRTYLKDDEWQLAIRNWMEQAALVLLIAGTTEWVRWEVRTIRELCILQKLIIVIPPGHTNREARIKIIMENLIGTDRHKDVLGFHPETLLAISFGANDIVRSIHGNTVDSIDYDLAVRLARALP